MKIKIKKITDIDKQIKDIDKEIKIIDKAIKYITLTNEIKIYDIQRILDISNLKSTVMSVNP